MSQPVMSDPIVLDEPLKRGEKEIKQIRVRKPKSGELRGLSLNDIMNIDVSTLQKLIPRVSEPTLIEADVAEMDPADLLQVGTEIAGFFIPKSQREDIIEAAPAKTENSQTT